MTEKSDEKKEQPKPQRNRDLGQQLIGGIIGALVIVVALQIGPSFGWQPTNRTTPILIGATIGAILFTLDRFNQAGARLTRRDDARALNIAVGVLGMLVLTAAVWGLVLFVSWIWRQFSGWLG